MDGNYTFGGQQKGFGVELVHNCNARCTFCQFGYGEQTVTNIFTGKSWVKQKKFMDWELIEAIFERHNPELFIFTGQSEPFLDSRIPDILELGEKKYPPFKISIFSNGSIMTDKILDKIVPNKNFASINFSLNAFSDDTRLKVMGIPYKDAEEKIISFLKKRRECGREVQLNAVSPLSDQYQDLMMGISFIAVHGIFNGQLVSNLHEIEPFREHWNGILREYNCNWDVGVFPAGNWGGIIPRDIICQDIAEINPWGCGQWACTSPTIDVDGEIMLCCYNSRWSFGSCLDDVAMGRWLNRRKILGVVDNVLHASPFCDECSHRFVPTNWNKKG